MLSTWESEVRFKNDSYTYSVDFAQWHCKLQAGVKITRRVGGWDIVKYTPESSDI